MPLGGLLPYDDAGGLMGTPGINPMEQGMLSPEAQQQIKNRTLLSLGLNMLANSGPSLTPTSLGQVIGQSGQQALSTGDQLRQRALQGALLRRKVSQEDREQRRQEKLRETFGEAFDEQGGINPETIPEIARIDPNAAMTLASAVAKSGKNNFKFQKDFPLPDGSTVPALVDESTGQVVPIASPIPEAPTTDERKQVNALKTIDPIIRNFEKTLDEYGTEVLPTEGKVKLKSDFRNIQLQLKELFNLGVLNGPDLDLLNEYLIDPTTITAKARGTGQVKASIEKVKDFIKAKEQALLESPGVSAREGGSILGGNDAGGDVVNWNDL